MIGEDVAIKEKPEDTRYISKITSKRDQKHRECGRRTRFPTLPLLETSDSGTGRVVTPGGSWEGVKSMPRGTTYHGIVGFIEPPVQRLYSHLSRCTRTESPPVRMSPACKLAITIMRTPYGFIPWPLWPILKHWRPDDPARGNFNLLRWEGKL